MLELHKSFLSRNSKEVFIFVSLRRLACKKGIIKMSYAIIRNANYKRDNLAGLYKHNERKNTKLF